MKTITVKINGLTGDVSLVDSAIKPAYGTFMQCKDVPESVTAEAVARQMACCAFFHRPETEPFTPVVVTWKQIVGKPQGSIIRY